MSTQQKDLSYYRLRLQEHLNSGFPEKASDHKFIDQRSSWAANAYEGAFSSGNAIEQCNEIANYILFEQIRKCGFGLYVRSEQYDCRCAERSLTRQDFL
ncbi:DUF1896 family protein [Sphingobacterium spiritivorum]|uniref:DUF1896 family protein n=1 Tax=Sphingobacterium spiritivorum TaxID=258 RepID=UPI000DFB24F8|nr:DUF1896 family protein [Sphingobacterium spiritivorum]WQD35921.1 DUF1896 family protein [Sphingobacterium spiritivorum]SUJ03028.1 Domain of uncharacterised function (DUF1896) [Sphingobacterium spiritivorum]